MPGEQLPDQPCGSPQPDKDRTEPKHKQSCMCDASVPGALMTRYRTTREVPDVDRHQWQDTGREEGDEPRQQRHTQ